MAAASTAAAGDAAESSVEHHDPLLVKFLETATLDGDWETLRHHLYLALLAAPPLFQDKPPTSQDTGPASSPTTSRDPSIRPMDISGRTTPSESGEPLDESLRPSTPGGLVIPPFPPLEPRRRKPTITVISANSDRLNGTPQMQRSLEEELEEETAIGGRKLPGWMDEDEAKREVDKLARKLEELSFPPFTLQRLTELLTSPTRYHKSLGKFLRAVDKMLVVTTAHEPPSYTYVPPPNQLPIEQFGSPSTSPATDPNSTVPPGSMTPMFSPIPFLSDHDDSGTRDDGLMSPLVLGDNTFPSGDRSPTPEPEEDAERLATHSDPGHQPYLGRVDELDSGPVTNGHAEEEGVGETGSMTPHGMSERPVALSSTTVISEPEREIAPLPRREES